jgi:hypothetical protein
MLHCPNRDCRVPACAAALKDPPCFAVPVATPDDDWVVLRREITEEDGFSNLVPGTSTSSIWEPCRADAGTGADGLVVDADRAVSEALQDAAGRDEPHSMTTIVPRGRGTVTPMVELAVLDEINRLLDTDGDATVNTSMRLPSALRDAAALAVRHLGVADSTTSLTAAALRR